VGHKKNSTTRTVYRHQLRPVITKGIDLLDGVFAESERPNNTGNGPGFGDKEGPAEIRRASFVLVVDTGIEPVTPRV
jgi:hypothetical protein